ncbi:MAG: hypothetical protein ACW987_13455 [Candidatus Thorarchaeota archaeon]|jgi:hypothetical protein
MREELEGTMLMTALEVRVKRIKFIEFISIAFLVLGSVVVVFGWIVLPIVSYPRISLPHPTLELIIGGLSIFIFGFLLYDYSEKKYIGLKKKYNENGGIPPSP